MTLKMMTAAKYPGFVRNHIHAIAGKNQAKAKKNAVLKGREPRRSTAVRTYIATPKNARGHHPQGGMEAATSRPATIGVKARLIMR
ncbi:unannotated protein [freshwater metagenome]|uniref:Unannotated protein n=1 Tax=freshwater metagenome TaxID=449393 RepID=A0A6J6I3B4_9ZZZZ